MSKKIKNLIFYGLLLLLIPIASKGIEMSINELRGILDEEQHLGLSVYTVEQGGTGAQSFTSGECLVGAGTSAITTQACGAGGGGNFAWTPDTNYGEAVVSTSTPIWFKDSVYASSTFNLIYASSTGITATNFWGDLTGTSSDTASDGTWADHNDYPSACGLAGGVVGGIGDTLACYATSTWDTTYTANDFVGTETDTRLCRWDDGNGEIDCDITDNSINWDTAYGWGDHSGLYDILGQATSTLSSHTTTYNHDNYDTAYGWGDHDGLYDVLGQATSSIATVDECSEITNCVPSAWDAISDMTVAGEAYGDLLYYNGSNWDDLATSSLKINSDDIVEGSTNYFDDDGVDDDNPETGDVDWTDLTDDGTFTDTKLCQYDSGNSRIDCDYTDQTGTTINQLGQVGDVSTSTLATGYTLYYNGSNWISSSTLYVDNSTSFVGISTTTPQRKFHTEEAQFGNKTLTGGNSGMVNIELHQNDSYQQALKLYADRDGVGTLYGFNGTAIGSNTKNVGLYGWAAGATTNLGLWIDSGDVLLDEDLKVSGNATTTGVQVISSLTNCNTIDTDANGLLSCGSDAEGADTWAPYLGSVGDVSTTSLATYDVLYYDGGNWARAATSSWDTTIDGCTNCLNAAEIEDIYLLDGSSDTMTGTLTTDGLTLGANENLTLGGQTLDHNGTNFVFSDTIEVGANDVNMTNADISGNITSWLGSACGAGEYVNDISDAGTLSCTDATTEINSEIGNVLDGTDAFTDINLGNDLIDNAHINWGDIDYLDDEGAVDVAAYTAVGTFASGDTFVCLEAGVGVRECDYDDLPSGMTSFILEDDDGTEISVSDAEEIKFIDTTGLTINWTDTSNGSDADPFDLTFTIVPDNIAGAISAGALANDSIVNADIDDDGSFAFTGDWDFGGGVLEMPNAANPTCDAAGEYALDTTDEQFIIADSGNSEAVFGRKTTRIWGVTVASTSPAFISDGLLKVPTNLDGYTMTAIRCSVQGGTNKIIAVEDGSANSTENITCTTSVVSDDGSITNATVTAAEEMFIDFGSGSGDPNYVSISVFGTITIE